MKAITPAPGGAPHEPANRADFYCSGKVGEGTVTGVTKVWVIEPGASCRLSDVSRTNHPMTQGFSRRLQRTECRVRRHRREP